MNDDLYQPGTYPPPHPSEYSPVQRQPSNAWLIAGAVAAGVLILLSLTVASVAVLSAPVQESAPPAAQVAPSPLTQERSALSSDLALLEQAWAEQSVTDRVGMCRAWRLSPEQAWTSFNGGADDSISKASFFSFFGSKC